MTDRLTLGYRRACLRVASPLGPAGTELRGHEFHYSTLEPAGDDIEWTGRTGSGRFGFVSPTLVASYVHVHIGAAPELAERLVAACGRRPRPALHCPPGDRGERSERR
jgi:cobyrinic acid a,c-diamide synthase